MENENPNENNEPGEETNIISKENPIDSISAQREKLKEENDAYEAEMLRAEQLRAEKAKGGRSEAGMGEVKPEPETDEEFTERFEAGEIDLTK